MSRYDHAGARSSSALCAAVAAVAVFSGTLVMLELSAPPPARATTALAPATIAPPTVAATTAAAAATTWDLEPRWWPGDAGRIDRIDRPAPAAPSVAPPTTPAPLRSAVADSDLTFATGYSQRLAARAAALAARLTAAAPPANTMTTQAPAGRNGSGSAHTGAAPTAPSLTVAPINASTDRPDRFDLGGRTLAFDEQRPRPSGVAGPHDALFGSIFGDVR